MADPTRTDPARQQPASLLPSSNPEQIGSLPPVPLTSFVGREREVAAVVGLLRRADVRLVTLTGPGGVGKTRVALRIAGDVGPTFEDGVAFVDLTPVASPSLVIPTIAQALGARQLPDVSATHQLVTVLQDRELLLVLDNLEQVADALPQVAELLFLLPRLKVLATSRVVLRVSGEHVIGVPPLGVPESRDSWEALRASDAVQLFAVRAQAAHAGFALTPENAHDVGEVVRRLDGLPLAIELAAARVAHLSPAALLQRLEQRLPLLTVGVRDAPARQRTLRDAIAWSHDLLTEEEQAVFRRVAVFNGGFTLDAAEAVLSNGDQDSVAALNGIAALVDQSLVRQEVDRTGSVRFSMLQTIREYAAERLDQSDDADEIRERHANYFAGLADSADASQRDSSDRRTSSSVAIEFPNMRAAASWALRAGRGDLALRLGAASHAFMYAHTEAGEALRWITAALSAPGLAGIDALWTAMVLSTTEDVARTTEVVEQAIADARADGDRLRLAKALGTRSALAEFAGAFAQAAALQHEILGITGGLQSGPDVDIVRMTAAINLADLHVWRGDPGLALPLIEPVLTWAKTRGHQWACAQGLQTLGAAAASMGDHGRAAELYKQVLEIRLSLDDWPGVAGAIGGVAGIAVGLGLPDQAARLLGAADAIRKRTGVRFGPHYVRGQQVHKATLALMARSQFDAAWCGGQELERTDAVAEALAIIADAQKTPRTATSDSVRPHGLTHREIEVVGLIAAGHSNQEIAAALSISVPTVKRHLTNILTKLDLPSRSALNTWAHDHRLA